MIKNAWKYETSRLLVAACCCSIGCRSLAEDRIVPQRILPVPSTVSPALQAFIGRTIPSDPAGPHTTQEFLKYLSNPDWPSLAKAAAKVKPGDVERHVADLCQRYDVRLEPCTVGGVKCFAVIPRHIPKENENRLLIGIHGGGYVSGAGLDGVDEAIHIGGECHIRTIAIDYRMPPRFPFPAPIDDALAVWKAVIRSNDPKKMGVFGSSTGGAMTLALVQSAQSNGLPLPGAIFAGTPWADLSKTGDSYFTNANVDDTLFCYEGTLEAAAHLYAGGLDLKDPRLSPIYGNFRGFPPTLLVCGTRDLFLSNTARVQQKLLEAHVEVELVLFEGQSHGEYMIVEGASETHEMLSHIHDFFERTLKR